MRLGKDGLPERLICAENERSATECLAYQIEASLLSRAR
jgi:hypothetical protein